MTRLPLATAARLGICHAKRSSPRRCRGLVATSAMCYAALIAGVIYRADASCCRKRGGTYARYYFTDGWNGRAPAGGGRRWGDSGTGRGDLRIHEDGDRDPGGSWRSGEGGESERRG